MKYIIFQDQEGIEIPVIFSGLVTHERVRVHNWKPVSAGMISKDWQASGKSTSLGLTSRPQDTTIIQDQFSY